MHTQLITNLCTRARAHTHTRIHQESLAALCPFHTGCLCGLTAPLAPARPVLSRRAGLPGQRPRGLRRLLHRLHDGIYIVCYICIRISPIVPEAFGDFSPRAGARRLWVIRCPAAPPPPSRTPRQRSRNNIDSPPKVLISLPRLPRPRPGTGPPPAPAPLPRGIADVQGVDLRQPLRPRRRAQRLLRGRRRPLPGVLRHGRGPLSRRRARKRVLAHACAPSS